LITGQTGSGKSSLLHTIIMSAILKYPPNELQIYLVDFKRGVEFKIYANHRLPSFRVVAIESEPEFGSSVLEHLDREQSRRSELFKRENVDEVSAYRKKTNETLPRVLLIIDEFHVFSKDNDLVSKSAAVHLEQIIRQGRAFGIHVILASQTLTNIGGIDRGIWGQVGVRIALKCSKEDAQFILGPDNDAVDLLSANDPGQAVYNSACGNKTANTIFRVAYIEQDLQNNLLGKIARHPKNQFVGNERTRVMLSNVEDNIYNPFQQFMPARPLDYFKKIALIVGEPLQLVNTLRMAFTSKASSNMLIIGNNDEKARTMFTFCVLSLVIHVLAVNDNKRPPRKMISLVDYAPPELEDENEQDGLAVLCAHLKDFVEYVTFEDSERIITRLYTEAGERERNAASAAPQGEQFLLIFGLQRARNLRKNEAYQGGTSGGIGFGDDFDTIGQEARVTPHDKFISLLKKGGECGIHSIIWENSFKTFMTHYGAMLPNFDLRIAFTMPDEDSVQFIEEPNGSSISENNAIFDYNGNRKFRPYKKPDLKWLAKIGARINTCR